MENMKELAMKLESEIRALLEKQKVVFAGAETEKRDVLTEEEQTSHENLQTEIREKQARLDEIIEKIKELEEQESIEQRFRNASAFLDSASAKPPIDIRQQESAAETRQHMSYGSSGNTGETRQSVELRASFWEHIRTNDPPQGEYKRYLATEGGLAGTIPSPVADTIFYAMQQMSPLRKVCKVGQYKEGASLPTAVLIDEDTDADDPDRGADGAQKTGPLFDSPKLTAKRIYAGIEIENLALDSSTLDLEAYILDLAAKAMTLKEDKKFLAPTAQLMTRAVEGVTIANANLLSSNIATIRSSVPMGVTNLAWLASTDAYQRIASLEDVNGHRLHPEIFRAVENGGAMVEGAKFFVSPGLLPVESGNVPILFGDFSAVVVADIGKMRLTRDIYGSMALKDKSLLVFNKGVDVVLTDPNSVKKLIVA